MFWGIMIAICSCVIGLVVGFKVTTQMHGEFMSTIIATVYKTILDIIDDPTLDLDIKLKLRGCLNFIEEQLEVE